MGKHEKLLERLKNRPRDFTFQELTTLLSSLGYVLNQKGNGSRVSFESDTHPPVLMHKPHPNNIRKQYQVDIVLEALRQEDLI
ncbi:MAG: hypothetical protein ACKVN9_00720 [Methylophilaceae bacterium]